MNTRRIILSLIAVLSGMPSSGNAEEYPSRPIKIIVPAAAGGGSDYTARLLAAPLTEALKQPVIVDARPGAAGNIGADFVAKAPANGYTLLLGHSGIVGTNPHMFDKLSYDVLKDLVPVAPVLRTWAFLFVPANSPFKTVKEFLQGARAKPGTLNYGSSGIGSVQHVGMENFKRITGIDITHVPCKGTAPATTALLAGEIDVSLDFIVPTMAYVEAGRLRVLGVASHKRLARYPHMPTLIEEGIPGFTTDAWVGLFATAGTPQPIIERLNKEVARVIATPAFQQALKQRGSEDLQGTPEEFAAFVGEEYGRGRKLVKLSGAKED